MGQGYTYVCKKCGKQYSVMTGIGFLFPQEYKQTMKKIAEGKQGRKRQELFKKIPFLAVDAENYYYECENCGSWSVEQGLDLYEPKDEEKIKKKQYGEETVEEWGEAPYVDGYQLKTEYVLIDRYEHKCPKCHSIMKKNARRKIISCPECGTRNRPAEDVLWD